MRIRILSDLHLEHHPFVIPRMAGDADSVLVLAGDVCELRRADLLTPFLLDAAERFRAVIYVLGNHEYYGRDWPDARAVLRDWRLPANLHVLEREAVVLDDVAFIGATLWTDFAGGGELDMQHAVRLVRDYRAIHMMGEQAPRRRVRLQPAALLAEHRASRDWLQAAIARQRAQGRRVVLVTHHGLTLQSIHPRFAGSEVNSAFVSDLAGWLRATGPDLAIHGHVHNSFDYCVGRTRVVVNPRGYPMRDGSVENPHFDPTLAIALA